MAYQLPDLTGKRLLVLGTGRGQVGLIRGAKEMGCTVIAATNATGYPGEALADEVVLVDILDEEGIAAKARELNVDGIATSCMDLGLPAQGYANDALGLVGPSAHSAKACGDKYLMKQMLIEHGVSTARYALVHNQAELDVAMAGIGRPAIIKATALQGSRGIYICREAEQVVTAFEKVMAETRRDYCIVEEFIEGTEFGAQSFVQNGEILFVLPHGDNTLMAGTAVPVGHYLPLEGMDGETAELTDKCVRGAIRALGLDNCAVNVDLILRDGVPYIIELTGRVGANCLCEITGLHFGIDYYKMVALIALGMDAKAYFMNHGEGSPAVAARMLTLQKSGTVKEIVDGHDPADNTVKEVTFFVAPGDEVRAFTNARDCVAQVVVVGSDLAACEQKIAEVIGQIDIVCE